LTALGETKEIKGWLARHAEAEAEKDIIPYSERAGSVVGIVVTILVVLYFVAHQTRSTGFFTSKFGPAEAFLFYAPLLYGLVPTGARVLVGRKNLARLFDVFGSVLSTVTLVWLYSVFPFDFSHFADVLPAFARFLLQWVSNGVARVLMVIGIIVAPITAVYTAVLYVFVRRELSKPTLKPT